MADTKLADMTAVTALAAEDIVYVVDDPGGTPLDRKATIADMLGSLMQGSMIDGLITSIGTDTDHDIDITAGVATVTDGTNWTVAVGSAITKQIDAAWAVGTNAGGMDTGSVTTSTWYHIWLIKRSDTGVVDALFSTSATAPTMPTNYDFKRRIGAVLTDGSSNILAYDQINDEFIWDEPPQDVTLTTSPTSWTSYALSTPLGVKVIARITGAVDDGSSSFPIGYFWHGGLTGPTATANVFIMRSPLASSATAIPDGFTIWTDTSSQIQLFANASTVDLDVRTQGWIDPRGRAVS